MNSIESIYSNNTIYKRRKKKEEIQSSISQKPMPRVSLGYTVSSKDDWAIQAGYPDQMEKAHQSHVELTGETPDPLSNSTSLKSDMLTTFAPALEYKVPVPELGFVCRGCGVAQELKLAEAYRCKFCGSPKLYRTDTIREENMPSLAFADTDDPEQGYLALQVRANEGLGSIDPLDVKIGNLVIVDDDDPEELITSLIMSKRPSRMVNGAYPKYVPVGEAYEKALVEHVDFDFFKKRAVLMAFNAEPMTQFQKNTCNKYFGFVPNLPKHLAEKHMKAYFWARKNGNVEVELRAVNALRHARTPEVQECDDFSVGSMFVESSNRWFNELKKQAEAEVASVQ